MPTNNPMMLFAHAYACSFALTPFLNEVAVPLALVKDEPTERATAAKTISASPFSEEELTNVTKETINNTLLRAAFFLYTKGGKDAATEFIKEYRLEEHFVNKVLPAINTFVEMLLD